MVDGAFLRGTVAILSGDPKIGKSQIALQLVSCACLGRPWLGIQTEPGRGLFFSCEDDYRIIKLRQRAINRSLDCDWPDYEGGLHLIDRVGEDDNDLATIDRQSWRMVPTRLFVQLGLYCARHSITYVVIDTVSNVFAGAALNARHITQFVGIMRRLAIAIGGVVLLLQHPSQAGRARGDGESGPVAWNASVRSRLYLREEPDGQRVLSGMAANYGPKTAKIYLEWDDGVFRPIDGQGIEEAPAAALSGADLRYRLLQGLARAINAGAKIRADEQHPESMARRAKRSHDQALALVPLGRLYDAQAEMIRAGELVMVDVRGIRLVRPAHGPVYPEEQQQEIGV
jgi:RecA-family ATPase